MRLLKFVDMCGHQFSISFNVTPGYLTDCRQGMNSFSNFIGSGVE